MQIVDDKLSFSMTNLLSYIFMTIVAIASIILVLPYTTVFILPLVFFYFYVQEWFTFYARELFRLDVIARSPLYTRFSETLSGLDTINCFRQRSRFVRDLERLLNHQQRAFFAIQVANGWLGVRIDIISLSAMLVTAFVGVLDREFVSLNHPFFPSFPLHMNSFQPFTPPPARTRAGMWLLLFFLDRASSGCFQLW